MEQRVDSPKELQLVERITITYDAHEDRLRLAVTTGDGTPWTLWLTRRLADTLINEMGEAFGLEAPGAGASVAAAMLVEQARGRAAPQPEPVTIAEDMPQLLIESFSIGRFPDTRPALVLSGRNPPGFAIALESRSLLRFLEIFKRQYVRGKWNTTCFPPGCP